MSVSRSIPVEDDWNFTVENLTSLYALDQVKGFGPVKFRQIHQFGVAPSALIQDPSLLPVEGKIGEKLKRELSVITSENIEKLRNFAILQIKLAKEFGARILTYDSIDYPRTVYESSNPVPILYIKGSVEAWKRNGTVAVVGSRKIRSPYDSLARMFTKTAAENGFTVVSGFAKGADEIGHRAAWDANGWTICVMPCGVDKVFPPENKALWESLQKYHRAVFISEFPFGRRTSALLLRKRNKTIAAFSHGVLVAQSAVNGGAMNAYRFGREQGKPVATFEPDYSSDTGGNELIKNDTKTGEFSFNLNSNPSEYLEWLKKFSCST